MIGVNEPHPSADNSQVFNVPNQISAARLGLSVLVFLLIPLKFYWAALVLFVVAAVTDWVDGWWARKYNLVTKLGRILDPFCDKILICGAFILLAVQMHAEFPWYSKIAGWMAVLVVGRELLVTVLRSLIEGAGGDFSAKMSGKLKMLFQCVAVGACLVGLALGGAGKTAAIPSWVWWVMIGSIWLAVISTVHSGIVYIYAAAEFVTGKHAGENRLSQG
jgi:CDP-diacylglycerol--glycerol-3-phosphate 3-phosphatidyltransferase